MTARRATIAAAMLLALLVAAAGPAVAASAPPVSAATAASTDDELQSLVDTLRNDKQRAALVRQLEAMIAARHAAAATPAAAPTDLISELPQRLDAIAGELLAGVALVLDIPRVFAWVSDQVSDAAARDRWAAVLLACAVVFGAAVVAEWLVRLGLARLRRRGMPRAEGDGRTRLLAAGLAMGIEMLPVAAFGGAAALAMSLVLPPFAIMRPAIALLVEATITARLIMAAAKAVLVPPPAWSSLVPASEETRNYLLIWVRRFACWDLFGFGIAGAAWWLGVPGAIIALMLKIVGLGLAAFATVFILQNREPIGHWIAGSGDDAGGWRRLRHQLGAVWHVAAIFYIGAIYLAYALHDEVGSAYVLRATALTFAALVAAQLLARGLGRLSARGFAIRPELKARFPLLEARANRYLPIVTGAVTVAIYAVAVLLVLQTWNVGSFGWFGTSAGRRVGAALLSIALVLAVALATWELLATAIERHLAALDHAGAPSRARRRTLLPLLRTAMAGVIAVVAGLVVLSQIGIDIAPLLAGAGVIGVAIGFGSQALIKDIITGLFILIEDQIAVGDIVDLGKDHAGVVEAISVRTIRLRDQAGIVHTVPFSEVASIKNLTRDFAYAVVRVGIAYGEDIDRVVEILRSVCDELAEDPEIGPLILDRFDYQGVDSLGEFSVVLLLRVRTLPGKNFVVGRALNRLIKIAFDTHGIAGRDPAPVMLAGPGRAKLDEAAAAVRRRTA